jgi:hypothetical protein
MTESSFAVDLRREFVGAFAPYVVSRLRDHGIEPPPGFDSAVATAVLWLDDALADLLGRPAHEQRRSPLEVFQEALRFPTRALEDAGVAQIERDPVAEAALPGDRYDLAPASSRDLGEAAWETHIRWGAAKAEAMRDLVPPSPPPRPVAGLFGTDLMDRTRIEDAARAAGYDLVVWRTVDDIAAPRRPVVAFIDLAHRSADDAVRALAGSGVRVVAFGPHVDDLALARAGALGADDALARSRFFGRLGSLFPAVT